MGFRVIGSASQFLPHLLNSYAWPERPRRTAPDDKYWAPVNRVDNVYGDRNLVCACPLMEDYAEPSFPAFSPG